MSCISGNCTIVDGATTNGTFYISGYNPNAPVPHWHQRMELATICIANSLTFIVIVARIRYRWTKLKHFRADDGWMAAAGFFLIGYTASQIGTNIYGSGLHIYNIPLDWLPWHWRFLPGWAGYYIITSCIKISVCFCFIEILPPHLRTLRYSVIGLCVFIACLGITMTFSWLFGCTPFLSNFVWSMNSTSCINYDILRWLWIGLSIPIDLILCVIPLKMLARTNLQDHERRILKMVFCATLLGTITCALGIYGVYETRVADVIDETYHEAAFVMLNDVEIFMYALGASFPVLSRYIVARSNKANRATHINFSSWARNFTNFFLPNSSLTRTGGSAAHSNQPIDHASINSQHERDEPKMEIDADIESDFAFHKLRDSDVTSKEVGAEEDGQTMWIDTRLSQSQSSDDDPVAYLQTSNVAGRT